MDMPQLYFHMIFGLWRENYLTWFIPKIDTQQWFWPLEWGLIMLGYMKKWYINMKLEIDILRGVIAIMFPKRNHP